MFNFLIFLLMIILFYLLYRLQPDGGYLALIPVVICVGLILTPIPFKNMIEGLFGYLDSILTVATGLIFLYVLIKGEILAKIIRSWVSKFENNLFLILVGLLAVAILPGMLTGSAIFAVAVNLTLLLPTITKIGFTPKEGKAFLTLASVLGMIAPPVNIPAMLFSKVINRAYIGYSAALWKITIPGMIFIILIYWFIGKNKFKVNRSVNENSFSLKLLIGLGVFLVLWILKVSIAKGFIGNISWPVIFLASGSCQWALDPKTNFFKMSQQGIAAGIHLLGLFMVSGVFVQIINFTGLKGELALQMAQLPNWGVGLILLFGLTIAGYLWGSLGILFLIPALVIYSGNTIWIVVLSSVLVAIGSGLNSFRGGEINDATL